MAQTEEEKQAAEDAKAQKAAEARVAELEKQLAEAEKKQADADAKAAELEGHLAATRMGAPMPMASGGTITVNAAGEVAS